MEINKIRNEKYYLMTYKEFEKIITRNSDLV